MKVNFIIGGAQKSGTTILKRYLNFHSQVEFSDSKENRFFIKSKHFRNTVDYTIYHDMYRHVNENSILGDKTPEYMYFEEAPKRLFEYNPNLKIIILLRNPVERAYSQYQRFQRHENTFKGQRFYDLIIRNDELKRGRKMVSRGLYCNQIRNIRKYFDSSQMFIELSDVFDQRSKDVLESIQSFLKIQVEDLYDKMQNKGDFKNKYKEMDLASRAYLSKLYYPEVQKLESLIQKDLSHWKISMLPYI